MFALNTFFLNSNFVEPVNFIFELCVNNISEAKLVTARKTGVDILYIYNVHNEITSSLLRDS